MTVAIARETKRRRGPRTRACSVHTRVNAASPPAKRASGAWTGREAGPTCYA